MNRFLGDDFNAVKNIFELFAYIATIVGAGGLIFAIKSFKKSEEDSKQTEQSRLMDNSIEVLKIFSSNLIPKIEKFDSEWQNKAEENKKIFLQGAQAKNKNIKELPIELIGQIENMSKTGASIVNIFNQLEQVCAYISYDLVIEDVVYPTVHKVFLEFLDANSELLKKATSNDAPYKNIHKVLKKWESKAKNESLDREITELINEKQRINK